MTVFFVIIAALAPVAWLLWTIYRKDSAQPEPTKWLVKAFLYGVASVFVSLVVSVPMSAELGVDFDNHAYGSLVDALEDAFLLAAIPEETAKLLMLWLLLRKNPFFDERFDGIVYAVCVGLGFAAFENISYLLEGVEDGTWINIGVGRALFSVPGHYFFAVLMGYYYSIDHFGIDRSLKTKAMIFVAPVLAHGLFDAILMSMQIDNSLCVLLTVLFIYFFTKLKKRANQRLNQLVNKR